MERLGELANRPNAADDADWDVDRSDDVPAEPLRRSDLFDDNTDSIRRGPRWYRYQISRYGALAGLIPMAILGAVSFGALAASDTTIAGLFGLLAGCAAAPVLLLFGAPFGDSGLYPLAVALSVPVWLAVGWLAARRTALQPLPGWRKYFSELLLMSAAVVAGAAVALGLASWWLGDGLIN